MVTLRIDPFPSQQDLNLLWSEAWGSHESKDFSCILSRSLAHVAAYEHDRLVGFVNVAWDGGIHAFILDTCVTPGCELLAWSLRPQMWPESAERSGCMSTSKRI